MRHLLSHLFLVLLVLVSACQNQRATINTVGGTDDEDNDPFFPEEPNPVVITFEIARVGSNSFQITDLSLAAPGAIKLRWSFPEELPTSCSLEAANGAVLVANAKATNSYQSAPLSSTTSFTISCNNGEFSESINVAVANADVELTLQAKLVGQPSFQDILTVNKGQSIDLRWTVDGNPSACSLILIGSGTIVTDAISANSKTNILIPQTSRFDLVCPKVGVNPDPSATFVVVAIDPPPVAAPSVILLENTPYTFPNTVSGQTVTRALTFKNTGNVNISALTLSNNLAPFSLVDMTDCTGSLVPNDTCTFQMRYSPTAEGLLSRGFALSFKAAIGGVPTDQTPYPFTLRGTGLPVPLPPICMTVRLGESVRVLASPGDQAVLSDETTMNPHLRIQARKRPKIRVDNTTTTGAVLTQLRMTIGDTRFNFSGAEGSFLTVYAPYSQWDDIQAPSVGGDLMTVNFGAGVPAGQFGLFSVLLEPDVIYPAAGGFFPHPDYRTVLFDMNNIDAWGGGVTPNAQVSATFRLNGVDKVTNTVTLPDFTVTGAAAQYHNANVAPYGASQPPDIYSTELCVP